MTKDPIAFQQVLAAFYTWAKTTELQDLTFMIPMQDREAAGIFFNYVQNSKYIFDETCNMGELKRMIDMQCLLKGQKEAHDMDTFCKPSSANS